MQLDYWLGAAVSLRDVPCREDCALDGPLLFSESPSRFVIEVAPGDFDSVAGLFKPGSSKTGLVLYLDQPSGRGLQKLDAPQVEQLCALGYISGKACEQK